MSSLVDGEGTALQVVGVSALATLVLAKDGVAAGVGVSRCAFVGLNLPDESSDWSVATAAAREALRATWDGAHQVLVDLDPDTAAWLVLELPAPSDDLARSLLRSSILGFLYSVSGDPLLRACAVSSAGGAADAVAAELVTCLLRPDAGWANGRCLDVEEDSVHVETIPHASWQVFSPPRPDRRAELESLLGSMSGPR